MCKLGDLLQYKTGSTQRHMQRKNMSYTKANQKKEKNCIFMEVLVHVIATKGHQQLPPSQDLSKIVLQIRTLFLCPLLALPRFTPYSFSASPTSCIYCLKSLYQVTYCFKNLFFLSLQDQNWLKGTLMQFRKQKVDPFLTNGYQCQTW